MRLVSRLAGVIIEKKVLGFSVTQKRMTNLKRVILICAVMVFSFVGMLLIIRSKAAAPIVDVEAESGSIAGNARLTSDVSASGGEAVVLGGSVTPPSGQSCVGRPDASCTGVPAGTSLSIVNGDVNITVDGTVIDGKDVRGFIIINADNVTVKNTLVRGRAPSGNGAMINIQSGSNILLEDITIAPATSYVQLDGVWGDNFIARRLDISGNVDGMKVGSNSTIEQSYIHDLVEFASDPNQGGGSSHNDGIQILSGSNITISGSNISLTSDMNAGIQITQDYGYVTATTINGNWFDGGGCTVNIAHKVKSSLSGVTLTNNRFGRNSYWNCPILLSTQSNVAMSNNVWDDNGQAVPVQRHD